MKQTLRSTCVMGETKTTDTSISLQVLSVIKWKGPKSTKLTSKFWKQMVYEMPVKQKEMLSRDQVKGQKYISRFILIMLFHQDP